VMNRRLPMAIAMSPFGEASDIPTRAGELGRARHGS